MASREPLPRGLVPLPGEGLPGFLLRLAHRLDTTPGQLIAHTGLNDWPTAKTSSAPRALLLMLDGDKLPTFARTTGLTPQEAQGLTLQPYLNRYPPVAEALVGRFGNAPRPRGVFPAWLLTWSTQYCPLCLAGDGSTIQQRHGGPWKTEWRLPVFFSCLTHQVFLQETCPSCKHPAGIGHLNAPHRMIAFPALAGLHPVQCRNTTNGNSSGNPCAKRFDSPRAIKAADRLTPDLIELQHRVLALLHAASPTAGPGTFADLRVLASYISASWPLTANLTPNEELAGALDRYLTSAKAPVLFPTHPASSWPRWDLAPPSAPAMAALLGIATQILDQPDELFMATIRTLVENLPAWRAAGWGKTAQIFHEASPRLREAVDQTARSLPANPRNPANHPTPAVVFAPRKHIYLPESVPQWLPDDWFSILVDYPSSGVLPRTPMFRRAVAVHLVQAATGLPWNEAGSFLGIPQEWLRDGTHLQPMSDRRHGRRFDIAGAFEALVAHVTHQPAVNRHRLRQRFAQWTLSEDQLQTLIDGYPGRRRRLARDTVVTSRLQACASAFTWSKITDSEWRLAPTMRPPVASPEGPSPDDLTIVWTLQRPGKIDYRPFYGFLAEVLTDHARTVVSVSLQGDLLAN